MKKIFNKISHLGLRSVQTDALKHKIILSNQINMIALMMVSIVLIIDAIYISINGRTGTFYLSLLGLLVAILFNLLLTSKGYFKITRVLLLVEGPLFLVFFVLITGTVIDEFYFWFQFIPTVLSVLPFYLYFHKADSSKVLLTLAIYFLLAVFMDNILDFFARDKLDVQSIVAENRFFYKITAGMIFIFVNLALFYEFNLSSRYETKLLNIQNQLDIKNSELLSKNNELTELNVTKDKFFRIIGHDLKNPISQVISFSELLEDNYKNYNPERMETILNLMKDSSLQGLKLLENLLEWAQTQTGTISFEPNEINLYDLVNENCKLVKNNAHAKKITIVNSIAKPSMIFADVNMLNTILRNLLSNAIKFTQIGGKIIIDEIHNLKGHTIFINDNGLGISKDIIDKLFRIDTNASTSGTKNEVGSGIGLILCKEFVNIHKGDIWVESEPNIGSTFYVNFLNNNKAIR